MSKFKGKKWIVFGVCGLILVLCAVHLDTILWRNVINQMTHWLMLDPILQGNCSKEDLRRAQTNAQSHIVYLKHLFNNATAILGTPGRPHRPPLPQLHLLNGLRLIVHIDTVQQSSEPPSVSMKEHYPASIAFRVSVFKNNIYVWRVQDVYSKNFLDDDNMILLHLPKFIIHEIRNWQSEHTRIQNTKISLLNYFHNLSSLGEQYNEFIPEFLYFTDISNLLKKRDTHYLRYSGTQVTLHQLNSTNNSLPQEVMKEPDWTSYELPSFFSSQNPLQLYSIGNTHFTYNNTILRDNIKLDSYTSKGYQWSRKDLCKLTNRNVLQLYEMLRTFGLTFTQIYEGPNIILSPNEYKTIEKATVVLHQGTNFILGGTLALQVNYVEPNTILKVSIESLPDVYFEGFGMFLLLRYCVTLIMFSVGCILIVIIIIKVIMNWIPRESPAPPTPLHGEILRWMKYNKL